MDFINAALNTIFGLLFLPFRNAGPVWPMLVISVITGVVMLVIFKATSDQNGIKRAKNLVKGHFLAIRLYKDDIGLMADTMKNIILSNLLYMKQSLRPMLFLLVPVAIILIQLGVRYEFRPLKVGEAVVVSLRVEDPTIRLADIRLDLPEGLELDMPPVRIEQLGEINWRVKATRSGVFNLAFKHGDYLVDKRLKVVDALEPIAAQVAKHDVGITIMNPAESSLGEASFASQVSISYPARDFEIWGFNLHWLVAFFIISLVAAFAFKGILGVEV